VATELEGVVKLAEFTLTETEIVRSLAGCGVQLNQHAFAKITGAPTGSFPDLEEKVRRLRPQLIRVFFNEGQGDGGAGRAPARKESFLRTARLARDTGATINVTWQGGKLKTEEDRTASVSKFADVLEHLVTREGLDRLRWVTIQNEPNTRRKKNEKTGKIPEKVVTPERLDDMYHKLDRRLSEKGLRQQIRFMVGDLIRESPDNQQLWFDHMDGTLAELMDAYSVHIYWNYFKTSKFEERLTEVQRFVAALRHTNAKPVFITEYGVRGHNRPPNPGILKDGTPAGQLLSKTNVAAFQQAWFLIRSMQLGYVGTVKWDCHHGKYDGTYNHRHYVIGPPTAEGWPLFPMYHLLRLVTLTTEPGWRVLKLKQTPVKTTKKLVAVTGPGNALTILGLDSRGALDNSDSGESVSYTIDVQRPNARFTLALWNRAGGGQLASEGQLSANAAGVAKVTAPRHAVFALTTKSVSV
jgi:hypothetical protein